MVENFVADEKNAGEHVFDDRIATDTSLVDGVKQLTTSKATLLNVSIQLSQCREELLVQG